MVELAIADGSGNTMDLNPSDNSWAQAAAGAVPKWAQALRSAPKLELLKMLVELEESQRAALHVVERRSAQARELAIAAST